MRLCQVLANLLSNAIKFTDRGEIGMTSRCSGGSASDVRLQFSVSDTGIGIAPQDQQMIFAPFTQVDATSTRRHQGSGPGPGDRLRTGRADARPFVGREHAGRRAAVLVHGGTRSAGRAARPGHGRPPGTAARPLALVVDDNARARAIVGEILAGYGMESKAVATGADALAALATPGGAPFEVVVADALMPGIDGFELATRMAAANLRRPLVMMLSAFDRRQFAARCDATPAVFVEKPLGAAELGTALMAALFGEPLRRSGAAGARAGRKAVAGGANPRNRRHAGEPEGDRTRAAQARPRGDRGPQRPAGTRTLPAARLRRGVDGRADADDGRLSGHGRHPRPAHAAAAGMTAGNVPVVALTAHVMKGDRERCLEAGMDAYLPKPLDANQAVMLVERLAAEYRHAAMGDARPAAPRSTVRPAVSPQPRRKTPLSRRPWISMPRCGGWKAIGSFWPTSSSFFWRTRPPCSTRSTRAWQRATPSGRNGRRTASRVSPPIWMPRRRWPPRRPSSKPPARTTWTRPPR